MDISKLTSREVEDILDVSRDTLKHWRYGYYTGSGGTKMYYRDDTMGVPCELLDAGQYQYYVYDLQDVYKWISTWKSSSKKLHALSKIESVFEKEGVDYAE